MCCLFVCCVRSASFDAGCPYMCCLVFDVCVLLFVVCRVVCCLLFLFVV